MIDCFRLRLNDDYKFDGNAADGSVYAGESNSLPAFEAFLRLVESRSTLLSSWWSNDKKAECIAVGMDCSEAWSSLTAAPEKSDIVQHYGDLNMPMQMRMFGEQVYGCGPGGQDGRAMLQQMMKVEGGKGKSVNIDMGKAF